MIVVRRVLGHSMEPTLRGGDLVVISTSHEVRPGSIVMARIRGREVIKRVAAIDSEGYSLRGDNLSSSTDSRDYGFVHSQAILGAMIWKLPSARPAPRLRHHYGARLGWIATAILAGIAVIQLFRIDTFVPLLDMALPGGRTAASWLAMVIIISEVFALPFLMRMKLSPLAGLVSGALSVLAPLWWLLIAIWSYDLPVSTAQLGEFVTTHSTVWVVLINAAWLCYAYVALWALGYDYHKGERDPLPIKLAKRLRNRP